MVDLGCYQLRSSDRRVDRDKKTALELWAWAENMVRKVYLGEVGEGGLGSRRCRGNSPHVFRPFPPVQHLLLFLLKGNWVWGLRVLFLRSDRVGVRYLCACVQC